MTVYISAQTYPFVGNDLWKLTFFLFCWCFMQASDVWSQPSSTNFRQCIVSNSHKSKFVCMSVIYLAFLLSFLNLIQSLVLNFVEQDSHTNGYIIINANGGLNQMRFGVRLLLYRSVLGYYLYLMADICLHCSSHCRYVIWLLLLRS